MPTGPETPRALDLSVLRKLEEELGGLEEFVQIYLDALPVRCAAIAQALADGDTRELRRTAHTLRSASAFVGAQGLAALCDRIEREARGGRPVPPDVGREVAQECHRVALELRTVIASETPIADQSAVRPRRPGGSRLP